jgi:hypothetical protein
MKLLRRGISTCCENKNDLRNKDFFIHQLMDKRIFLKTILKFTLKLGDRGSTVFKVLCYKSEGRWFDPS